MGFFSRRPLQVTRVAASYGAVPRSTTTLMQQRGWQQAWTGAWSGPYATQRGTWPGRIERAGDTFRVFVRNPPPEMRRHPKWPCFNRHDDSGWYRIHLHTSPVDRDANAVIRYVEQIITESFKL